MPAEMSLVDRDLKTLMSCGRSEIVVSVAPTNPRAIIKFIGLILSVRYIDLNKIRGSPTPIKRVSQKNEAIP